MLTIDIEGFSINEILRLPVEDIERLIVTGRPIVFRAGSAEILGEFQIKNSVLLIELAHIDGGGEGVLPLLSSLARRYAIQRGLGRIEWIVHAVNCAEPNLKLCRVLERRGFEIMELPGKGSAYTYVDELT